MLRRWQIPAAKIHGIVAITEEEDECTGTSGLLLVRDGFVPSAAQQSKLDDVLASFEDVLSPNPGLTDMALLSITTGDNAPVRSHPYRIPPKWKEEVRQQIEHLLALAILRPSDSPWYSSIVTVGKKDVFA